LSHDPWHNWQAQQHPVLSLELQSDLRGAVWWRHKEAPGVADAMIKAHFRHALPGPNVKTETQMALNILY